MDRLDHKLYPTPRQAGEDRSDHKLYPTPRQAGEDRSDHKLYPTPRQAGEDRSDHKLYPTPRQAGEDRSDHKLYPTPRGAGQDRSDHKLYPTPRGAGQDRLTLDRADSLVTKVCDLHVYKVPIELWRHGFNNVLNNVLPETVSVGVIRVPAELRLSDVRAEMAHQLAVQPGPLVPAEYVFLRCVGRSLTTLRGHQERQLKAKHFVPPVAYAPELYILEATSEVKDALAARDTSVSPVLSPETSPSHRAHGGHQEKAGHRRHDGSQPGGQSPAGGCRRRQRDQSDSPGRTSRDGRPGSSSESSGYHKGRQPACVGRTKQEERDRRDGSAHDTSSDEDHTATSLGPLRLQANRQKNQLGKSVHEARQTKLGPDTERQNMMTRAKQIRHQTIKQRNEARDVWKKRYLEEKRRTSPLEDMSFGLENELDALHDRHMSLLEGPKEKIFQLGDGKQGPSEKSNYVIQCARLLHQIQELQRRVDKTGTRLTAEVKLRVQAQTEMKVARTEAMRRRLALRATRTHQGGALGVGS